MAFLPASAINGSALPAEMIRLASWAATNGATGIIGVSDLLVQGLSLGGVSIGPGGAVIATRFPLAAKAQSYMVSNDAANGDAVLAVPAAGSGGPRVDYVIIRIDDPQYAGSGSAKGCTPLLVSSITSLNYPFVALAKLVQPAGNTAGIQPSMVTDLRKVAVPRSFEVLRVRPSLTGDDGLILSATWAAGEWFPNAGGNQDIDVPEWAVRAQIEAYWVGVRYPANLNPYGECWVEYGPYSSPSRALSTQHFAFDCNKSSNNQRTNWIMADDVYIPASYRGTTQGFTMYARYTTGADRGVSLTATSGAIMKVKFLEQADPSSS